MPLSTTRRRAIVRFPLFCSAWRAIFFVCYWPRCTRAHLCGEVIYSTSFPPNRARHAELRVGAAFGLPGARGVRVLARSWRTACVFVLISISGPFLLIGT